MNTKRGEVNIVATMLIFALMISSLGVLYSQISPTLLGYESRTQSAQQEFIFTTIAHEFEELTTATEGAQRRVHIFAEDTIYDVSNGYSVTIDVLDGGSSVATHVEDIGLFTAQVNGSFQASGNPSYLNRVLNENTYVNNMTMSQPASYVSKAEYSFNKGNFSLYFRPWISVVDTTGTGNWLMTIVFVQIDFQKLSDGSALDFPVQQDEWTLRLRRQQSIVSADIPITVNGPITVDHTAGTNTGSSYTFPSINIGDTLNIRYITVPILFSI